MRTFSVRVRLLIVAAVAAVSLWAIYPADKIKLGLDLKGGVQLVLRVRTDDALRRQTVLSAEQVQDRLERSGQQGRVEPIDESSFKLLDVADERSLRDAAGDLELFQQTTAGSTHTFRLKPEAAHRLRREAVQLTMEIIERRVNELGVSEPSVAPYTDEDQIALQLPGIEDMAAATDIIQATGQLSLTVVERGPFASPAAAHASYDGVVPANVEILPGSDGAGGMTYYVVSRTAAVTGTDLRSAQASLDEFNRPAVGFTLRPEAGRRFGELTARSIGRTLATVANGRVASLATITSRIDDRGQIVGLTQEEVKEQVITLRSGALPAGIDLLGQFSVGASLGQDSIRAGVAASLAGLVLVTAFMLAYYRAMGVNAFVSIVLNLLILLALMAAAGATLTLPGIAGLVLTIGMGVDSNVLIFERIREERATAAGARAAVRAAFDRVWVTIVDTHVASLLAAAMLFQFGTGAIRGFAATLTMGLVANVFTSVFVSRTLFDLTLPRNARPATLMTSGSVSPDQRGGEEGLEPMGG
jgi:preprotein translocase subunit SecD